VKSAVLYARLWTQIGGVWQYNDYTFTGASFQMLLPVPGSTLPGGSATFTWTPIAGVSQYSLYFGTTPGGYDLGLPLFAAGTTSYMATNLPIFGATLYLRLWCQIGGAWQYVDYTYTEANLLAKLLTPVPGSILTGTSITFTWTAAPGATQYSPYFGTTPGGHDLGFPLVAAPTNSYTATLPVLGAPLYVRLWTQIGGVWQYIDYTYTH
jgi:hypothetical protein